MEHLLHERKRQQDLARDRQLIGRDETDQHHDRERAQAPVERRAAPAAEDRDQGERNRDRAGVDGRRHVEKRPPVAPLARLAEGVGQEEPEREPAEDREPEPVRRAPLVPALRPEDGDEERHDRGARNEQACDPGRHDARPGREQRAICDSAHQKVNARHDRGEERGLRMSGDELQRGERAERGPTAPNRARGEPLLPRRGEALDRENDPRNETERVPHRKQEEGREPAGERIDDGGERRARLAGAEAAGQEKRAARRDGDAKPRQEKEAELERQQGEQPVQRKERRALAVAPERRAAD